MGTKKMGNPSEHHAGVTLTLRSGSLAIDAGRLGGLSHRAPWIEF